LPRTRCVFDLALLDRKILVEFDGAYHDTRTQSKEDLRKDRVAQRRGWNVVRLRDSGKKISSRILQKIL
jgi:very-short-patch-repair endonuclease